MNGSSFFHRMTVYDPHITAKYEATIPQLALLWIWMTALFLYLIRLPSSAVILYKQGLGRGGSADDKAPDPHQRKPTVNGLDTVESGSTSQVKVVNKLKEATDEKRFSKVKPPPTFKEFLQHVIQLGVIMLYFYFSDYVKIFPRGERIYSRDTFLFIIFLLFLIGIAYTTRSTVDKMLNRDITEEWKGWMQVMFVWYHYFAAVEWYNWIRVYIAAYVWMTGFGNFSFFWVKKDYSLWRASKMLFRLNFLVIVICGTVSNPYMLYYICPMHTYWFLSVYCFMAVGKSWNDHRGKMAAKLLIYAVVNSIIFDVPGLTERIFYPLWPLLGFEDGNHTLMHEWSFRLGLDHWVCFIGMLCAYNYPYFEAFMQRIESSVSAGRFRELVVKLAISLPILVVYVVWHAVVLGPLDKLAYNRLHPYLSFVPIIAYIWFRNLFPALRNHYVHLFAELGKITLETYLTQLHAYLQSNAKEVVSYIPGYPLLNFAFNTIIYITMSHMLFTLTANLSAYLIPIDANQVRRRALCALLVLIFAFVLGAFSRFYLWTLISYL